MARDPDKLLQDLRSALFDAKRAALAGIWAEGLRQKAKLADLFEISRVLDEAGNVLRVMRTSARTTAWKLRNGLDPRDLHMTNTLQNALRAPQSFIKVEDGFTISVPRANFMARIPGRPAGNGRRARRSRATFLNRYFRYANRRAFFRIGKLGLRQILQVRAAGMDAIKAHLQKLLGAAIKVKGGITTVNVELGKLGLERV